MIVMFLVTFGGTFLSYKVIKLATDEPLLDNAKFWDVFTGYKPRYKKGATLSMKAADDFKASQINNAIDEIVPYVLIALFCFLCLAVIAGFKVYSNSWWRG